MGLLRSLLVQRRRRVTAIWHPPAATSLQVQLPPDESLCSQFIGHPGSVKYTAIVHDGGTDLSTLTERSPPQASGLQLQWSSGLIAA